MPDFRQGIGTAVLALTKALSESGVDDQEYTVIVREDKMELLKPYVYGPCKLEGRPRWTPPPLSPVGKVKSALSKIPPAKALWDRMRRTEPGIPNSDGYVESMGFDVVHFPTQMAFRTAVPSIYQPWDLQHLHYPEFFSAEEIARRDLLYPAFCKQAAVVCVQAEWTRQDVMSSYGLAAEKMAIVPWGSVFEAYAAPDAAVIEAAKQTYQLPAQFLLYPAATWPHKNHEIIFHALSVLKRHHGLTPTLYCTGQITDHRAKLDELATRLGIQEQVRFLGFVSPGDLQALFSLAQAMVFASRFEGFGLPLLEAFQARLPVLAARATTLPEVGADAALYFGPDSAEELAEQIKRILSDESLRDTLRERGLQRLSQLTMAATAAGFHALYAKVASANQKQDGR